MCEGGSQVLVRSDFHGNTLKAYDVTHVSDVTTQLYMFHEDLERIYFSNYIHIFSVIL